MQIKYFLQEYIKKLPYIAILITIAAFSTHVFHGHMVMRELLVNMIIINLFVMYWGKWFPSFGEFRLQESLLNPVLLIVITVLPISLYASSHFITCSGEYIKIDAVKCLFSAVLVAVLVVVLDKSRYT